MRIWWPLSREAIWARMGSSRAKLRIMKIMWREECPPIRAANAFGFDLLANFDVTFLRRGRNSWEAPRGVVIESDFDYTASEGSTGKLLVQQYAWFWEKGQKIPHV